ncbi:unnamed protein product [Leptosia nina]|uniref:C2H2-type domain-containing protein n=1 Tax=Leptosia nina TaxID=320188 RepID=A0AAV1J8S0_9NEOP
MTKPFKNDSRKNNAKNEKNVHQRDTTPPLPPRITPASGGGWCERDTCIYRMCSHVASPVQLRYRKLPALRSFFYLQRVLSALRSTQIWALIGIHWALESLGLRDACLVCSMLLKFRTLATVRTHTRKH